MAKKREIGFIERERELSTRHLVKTLRRERIFRPDFQSGVAKRMLECESTCLSITASFNEANVARLRDKLNLLTSRVGEKFNFTRTRFDRV